VASTKQLSQLFRAIAARNFHDAETIAENIVVTEQKRGHRDAVRILKSSLRAETNHVGNGVPSTSPISPLLLTDALSAKRSPVPLARVKLRDSARNQVGEIVREWTKSKELAAAGIPRRTRLLFYGPPGCGKSLTALALGEALSIPTYIVRFDSVIGAYLGQTAIHLRQLFRFAEQTPCVLVFDEVDALAKQRGNPLDVGELDRIVIAVMQELEHANVRGLVIATSNLPKHIDRALWRRFDLTLAFPKPTVSEVRAFAVDAAKQLGLTLPADLVQAVAKANSYAEVERLVEHEARRRILSRR